MVDLSEDPVAQLDLVLGELEKARIITSRPKGKVDIEVRFPCGKTKNLKSQSLNTLITVKE